MAKSGKNLISYLGMVLMVMGLLSVAACTKDEPTPDDTTKCSIELGKITDYSVAFTLSATGINEMAYYMTTGNVDNAIDASYVLTYGTSVEVDEPVTITLDGLQPQTTYTIYAATRTDEAAELSSKTFTTLAPPAMAKNHTLLLMLHGDNDLNKFMDTNLQRVITAYSHIPADGRILVFYDRGNYTRLTELYSDDGMVKQRLIKEFNKGKSSLDVDFMVELFDLIEVEAPSDSYGLIFSSHGGGWAPGDVFDSYITYNWDGMTQKPPYTFYGQDQDVYMDIPDLARALESTVHFDYILFDACLMASVEALYDLRHAADYIIASSVEVLAYGFPYQDIVPLLFQADHALERVCKAYVDIYRLPTAEVNSATISLVDCTKLEFLAAVMKHIKSKAADKAIDFGKVQVYDGYPISLFYDLEDYAEQLATSDYDMETFRNVLDAAVPYTDHTPIFFSGFSQQEIPLPDACGLTCHIERQEFPATHEAYLQTSWAKAVE